jgi:MFS family permease
MLRVLFMLTMGINLLVTGPFEVGIPVLAKANLAEGAAAYGIIMSAFGGGALVGIVLAGVMPRPKPSLFGVVLLSVLALMGVGLVLLPWSHSTPIVAGIALALGSINGYVNLTFITWLQKRIPGHLMGRVMSLLMFASFGLMPVSTSVAGFILQINLTGLFVGAGILMTLLSLYAASLPVMRQMGLETAADLIIETMRKTGEVPAVQA